VQQTSQGAIGAMTREATLYGSCFCLFCLTDSGQPFVDRCTGTGSLSGARDTTGVFAGTEGNPCLRAVAALASSAQRRNSPKDENGSVVVPHIRESLKE
jgi:hydroxyethylthiazole kinase-like sugar kinase family protein